MATITNKSLIGPQGKVLVNGLQWHDTATEVTWDHEIVTVEDHPIHHDDTKLIHIDKRVDMTLESRHVADDSVARDVIEGWGASSTDLADVVISGQGMKVGDVCEVHRVLPSGKNTEVLKNDVVSSSLMAESSGLSFTGEIEEDGSNLGEGVYVLTSDYATGTFEGLVSYSHTGTTSERTFEITDSNNDDEDKNKMVIFAVAKVVSGIADLTTDTTAKLVMHQSPALAESHVDYVAPVDLTEELTLSTNFYKTALVLDTPDTSLNKISLEVDFGDLPAGTTNYNVVLRVGVSTAYAKAVDVS